MLILNINAKKHPKNGEEPFLASDLHSTITKYAYQDAKLLYNNEIFC